MTCLACQRCLLLRLGILCCMAFLPCFAPRRASEGLALRRAANEIERASMLFDAACVAQECPAAPNPEDDFHLHRMGHL